jgi:hypothetical protein
LGFGARFGGFLQLAETLDPHLPQEFPPAGEMRRGGNTRCELKIVVGDFELSHQRKPARENHGFQSSTKALSMAQARD